MMRKTTIRNAFATAGAYYISLWVAPAVVMAFTPITNRVIFTGAFEAAVVMPLLTGFPMALVAAAAGAVTAWLVESRRAVRWAFLPATLYAVFSLVGHHWATPPQPADRVAQLLQAILPAAACLLGAALVERRLYDREDHR
jgi:hypothetical protein